MLTSLSPVTLQPLRPRLILPRRRGGQPANRNAFKHGLYSAKPSTPPMGFSPSPGSSLRFPPSLQSGLHQALPGLQQKYILALRLIRDSNDSSSILMWARLLLRLATDLQRIQVVLDHLEQPLLELRFVAGHSLALIRLDMRSQGITRDADSFLEKRENSDFYSRSFSESHKPSQGAPFGSHSFLKNRVKGDFNSLSGSADLFLTPRQWAVLEPLLPPLDHAGRRGRPPADPRKLLAAIFWKAAHHARWQDLPEVFPPMLTCRRYYRRLFLSGRLATLYAALYHDLRSRGNTDLAGLVEQGCFEISRHRLAFRPALAETWQLRTALLFLQQGYQVFRLRFGTPGKNGYEI